MNKPQPVFIQNIRSAGRFAVAIQVCATNVFFVFLLSLLALPALAQNEKAIYERTVDQFNRITMRYVLAADTEHPEAPELARKLEDPAYDLKGLSKELQRVYNGKSKTETLSSTIAEQKAHFVSGKPLAQQLTLVLQLIYDNRKDKPYFSGLQNDLVAVRDAALKEAVTAAPTAAPATPATADPEQLTRMQAQINALQQRLDNLSATSGSSSPAVTASLPWYVWLLLALLTGLSALNFWQFRQYKNRRRSHSAETSAVVSPLADNGASGDASRKVRELEKKMDNLRSEWKRDLDELRKDLKKTAALSSSDHQGKETPVTGSKPGTNLSGQPKSNPAVSAKTVTSTDTNPVVGQTIEMDVKKTVVEPEKPPVVKKYTDYPKENGFPVGQLSDTSDRRSIFEISMQQGLERATFSIVNDPAIHEYAIQNRERLLRDACDFEISSSKHTRIEVVEPGTLLMNGNAWQIQSKAKIKFV
jgi:hypothetical protein